MNKKHLLIQWTPSLYPENDHKAQNFVLTFFIGKQNEAQAKYFWEPHIMYQWLVSHGLGTPVICIWSPGKLFVCIIVAVSLMAMPLTMNSGLLGCGNIVFPI